MIDNLLEIISGSVLIIIALIIFTGACIRIFGKDSWGKRFDQNLLLYLGLAAILLLVRDIKSLSWGDYKLEFHDRLEKAEAALMDTQAMVIGRGKANLDSASTEIPKSGSVPKDPWKGAFGGKSEVNGRRLDAKVEEISEGWYAIDLVVRVTDGAEKLEGYVQFFLHPTFLNDHPVVTVVHGQASLHLEAYGAFTVGVIADGGNTLLELDLAEDKRFPQTFRDR